MNQRPLEGIRVLDFTRFVSGPYCSQLLGSMGAEIIKIEKGTGDTTRSFAPHVGDRSVYYCMMNYNKKSVNINGRKEGGKALLWELVKTCDVIVENFRPGTLEKMGFTREALDEVNPGIIVTHVSGFGQDGPYKDRTAFDCIAQAMSGVMSVTGEPGQQPTMIGTVYLDYMGGTFAALATVLALYERKQSGKGQDIDVAMLDAGVSYSLYATQDYILNGRIMQQEGNHDRVLTPANAYKAKDGKYVFLHVGSDLFFDKFCKHIGREDLLAEDQYKYAKQRMADIPYMDEVTGAWVAQHDAKEIDEQLNALGLPCSIVANAEDVVHNPQVQHRNMIQILEYPDGTKMPVTGIPFKLSRTPGKITHLPSDLGADTEEVLRDVLGKTDDEIAMLREDGSIG